MARLIWTEPALHDLDEVAEYIALDDPPAASRYVKRVFNKVERLKAQPHSGRRPPEFPRMPYREVIVAPCRIFYRVEDDKVFIVYVMRSEQLLRAYRLEQRGRKKL